MKKLVFIILSVITVNVFGSNTHSLNDTLPYKDTTAVQVLELTLQQQRKDLEQLRIMVTRQEQKIETLRDSNCKLASYVEVLVTGMDTLKETSEKQGSVIQTVTYKTEMQFLRFQKITNCTLAIVLIVCTLVGMVSWFLFRKSKKEAAAVRKMQSKYENLQTTCSGIQRDIAKLDCLWLQLMDSQTANLDAAALQESHGLVLKVADEIVRIETNLLRMDSSVKGYKQLVKAVERIKANFLANGYEIVDMLAKPYNEGMKVTANFVTDETLAEGVQIITGIIKPQINYCGKMIQAAQITVNQNL
ncbi:MAG: hypothetical protein IKZ52_00980 [Bacteroidales bacterium]|nr:hypothetical protein [Bacteroidales bacterium]